MNQQEKLVLNYPLFDGEKVMESASVIVENSTIMAVNKTVSTDRDCLLMPVPPVEEMDTGQTTILMQKMQ